MFKNLGNEAKLDHSLMLALPQTQWQFLCSVAMFVDPTGAAVPVPEPVNPECQREHAAEESRRGQTLRLCPKPLEKGRYMKKQMLYILLCACYCSSFAPPIAPPTQISSVVDENGSFDVTPLK